MEMRDLCRTYTISPALSASIIPLQEAESRGLVLDLEEPPGLASRIAGYDALFSTGLSKDYVDKREFSLFIAIRELLQNALDEEELVRGRADVRIEQDAQGTWIVDRGRGITVEALRMGGSDKECWMRGYYGEGLKLAAAYLTLNRVPVYLFAGQMVFRFIALPRDEQNPGIFILLGRSKETIKGTQILLFGYKANQDFMERIVRFWNKDLEATLIAEERFPSEDCPREMPSAIFDFPNQLYIRNMYAGEMSEVSRRKSLLSYDLWWFRFDVSRKLMTQKMPQLFLEIAKVLERSATARKKFAEKLVEAGMLKTKPVGRGLAIDFNPTFTIVEGHLFVYAFPKGMLEEFVKVLGLEAKRDLIRRVSTNEEAESAVSKGLIPILFPYELSEQFSSIPPLQNHSFT
ncbi:MAG: ATP-binding protein [Syntrophorhabdales bacterium]|jgi:hypothetical protein